jgi:sugar phosphate isomerase/epimerase
LADKAAAQQEANQPLFKISLAQWSLHRTLQAGKLDNLDFPALSQAEFGIDAVEYVNQFFKDKARDKAYLAELKQRSIDAGVFNHLIMIDGEGALGDPEAARRTKAVENHYPWVEAAKALECITIRVNAHSEGSDQEQQKLAADGLHRLCEFGVEHKINIIVENHGGLSSNGQWLAGVMRLADMPNCGTLPDFGNFHLGDDRWYDRYQGVAEMMPYAKAVSAKSKEFDASGNEVQTDYMRMMKIVLDAGFHSYVGIEWEGEHPDEYEGIRLTKRLLEKVRGQLGSYSNQGLGDP